MTLDEKIHKYTQKLPLSLQEELLEYAQYLVLKAKQLEKQEWSSMSLSSAMQGMDDESSIYSPADIKEVFA